MIDLTVTTRKDLVSLVGTYPLGTSNSDHNLIYGAGNLKLHTDICGQHSPWKEIKVRASSSPLITSDIRLAMNRGYKLFKAPVTSKCAKLWSDYKRARNKVTSDLRRAKTSYFSKMFNEVESLSA